MVHKQLSRAEIFIMSTYVYLYDIMIEIISLCRRFCRPRRFRVRLSRLLCDLLSKLSRMTLTHRRCEILLIVLALAISNGVDVVAVNRGNHGATVHVCHAK
eukprot:SAG11_NODE_2524_length_3260_cov_1.524518_4_plen_101_part_00